MIPKISYTQYRAGPQDSTPESLVSLPFRCFKILQPHSVQRRTKYGRVGAKGVGEKSNCGSFVEKWRLPNPKRELSSFNSLHLPDSVLIKRSLSHLFPQVDFMWISLKKNEFMWKFSSPQWWNWWTSHCLWLFGCVITQHSTRGYRWRYERILLVLSTDPTPCSLEANGAVSLHSDAL